MPEYLFECPLCGEFNEYYSMRSVPQSTPCPKCGASSTKLLSPSTSIWPDTDWSHENGGRGREAPGLKTDPAGPTVYVKSPQEFKEIADKKGLIAEKA